MTERSTLVLDNLRQRHRGLMSHLGELAYSRRDLEIQIEKIDAEVSQLEGQKAILEVTTQDCQKARELDRAIEEKEREDAKNERSKRAKDAAKKRKREKAEKKSRESESSSST